MNRVQPRLTIAILFTALILLTFFATAFVSAPIDYLYRNASGLSSAHNVAQIAALLAAVGIFVTGFIVAVPTASQPTSRFRKLLYVLPGYFLVFTLVGIIAAQLGVGTVGTLLNIQGIGSVTFATAWIAVGAIFSTIAVVIAAARVALSTTSLKYALTTTAITGVLSLVATIAMIVSVVIVSTSQPSASGFGRPDGQFPPGGQGAPAQGASNGIQPPAGFNLPESTSAAPAGGASGQNPAGQNQGAVPAGVPGQGGQGGFPPQGGQFPPGGARGTADAASHFELGGVLMAIFAVVALIGLIGAAPALRQSPVEASGSPQTPRNYRREIGLALVSCVGVTLVLVGVSQLGQVSHVNPPVQTMVNWDSPLTQDLATRACIDCHSNETTWPWYSYIAPASWLTALHVAQGRQEFDLSELNILPAFRKANLANDMAQQIRSGAMPPKDYLLLHPDARLTDAEKQALIQGLQASIPNS